uniref:Craniofacial development protein 2 n=1 Tax=Cacopsylla melanoneura TaxID=428564 RepID=A0A8D8XEA4_9HEMI
MMNASNVKFSGSKRAPQSDFRVGTAQEAIVSQVKSDGTKRIGTWNVRTLLKDGKIENLKIEMEKMKLDILGISEMRWASTGDFWTDEFRVIYSGSEEGPTGRNGVGIVLTKKMGLRVTGYVQHSDRIILVKMDTKPNSTVIIQVYMPTTNAVDEEIERMYEDLNNLIDQTKAEDNLIVMGDMNATVGEEREGTIVGQYGLGDRNERGRRLIEFCARNKLVISNTHFKHHKRRRYTWKAPGDVRRAQIDYIMVRERFKNQVKNSRSYPSADIESDHNLVIMHCELKYKKLTKRKPKPIDMSMLKDPIKRREYTRKTDSIAETSNENLSNTIEDQWTEMKKGILDAAETVLKKDNTIERRKPWISEEVLELIHERRKYKTISDEEGQRTYRRLRNEINRKCKRDKELNDICEEINNELNADNLDKAYGMVKQFFGEAKKKSSGIQNEIGQLVYEEKEIAKRWKEYLEKLYGDSNMNENTLETEDQTDENNKGEDITIEEFVKAMSEMKSRKAPGLDEVPAELLTNCGEKAKAMMYKIITNIYETGIVPSDFTKCLIIPIPKKARAQTCDQYRTLSLTSHASKILTRIILRRIETLIDNSLTDDQFGFRRGIGTREAILTLRQVIEKRNRKGIATFMSFVDLEKAFDNVNWDLMFELLKRIGISFRDRRIIHSLYKNEVGVIRCGDTEEEAVIKKGVRQGCSLSPYLFNLYVQEAINKIREECQVGIDIEAEITEKVDMLRFADDIAIVTDNENDLQNILHTMNNLMKNQFNMKINKKKTKILICSRMEEDRQRTLSIKLEDEILQQVTEYKYLGSLITNDGTSRKEIISRIGQAKCAFNKKKELFTSRSIDLNLRKRLIKTYVWSVALYGSETWTIAKAEQNRLMAFEMWCWRKMQKISWIEHMTNEEVLRRAGEQRSFMKSLKKRRAKLIGHILRHNSLLARVIEGKIEGSNTQGRPPLGYLEQIMKDVNVPTYRELKRKAGNREEWRDAANQPNGC